MLLVPVSCAPPTPAPPAPQISREQAIEIATKMLPARLAPVVARSDVRAESHGWYWEVIFDNVNATYDELTPIPLKPPVRGPTPPAPGQPQSIPESYQGIFQSVAITVDAETGDPLSAGASRMPKPGPYVNQEQAIVSAQRYVSGIPLSDQAWLDGAMVDAYLRGDTWIVLFWEEGSSVKDKSSGLSVHRIRVLVDAVTGVADGASRG